MNICVLGLWHLGSVTSACLAELGHRVVGLDFDERRIASLNQGTAPVFEPGLEELLRRALASGTLRFSADAADAVPGAQVLWVACDTPVDEDGEPEPKSVIALVERVLPYLGADTLLLVSSQLPVGSVRRLQRQTAVGGCDRRVAYLAENLRLGSAVNDFLRPPRLVVGAGEAERGLLEALLHPLGAPIEWMSVESAEMTKHALNAFLAASVTFANEVARICESVGADAQQVERGLKSDPRIGPRAYLAPGTAFAGGTLAREVAFLNQAAREQAIATPLLASILPSNAAHRLWAQQALRALFENLSGITVAVWGLTYKPGTDTLRRSLAVELCDWLLEQGATIHVHDPVVGTLPQHWRGTVERFDSPLAAVRGAHALVLATAWPLYQTIGAAQLLHSAPHLAVLDGNRFLPDLAAARGLRYLAVGLPGKAP